MDPQKLRLNLQLLSPCSPEIKLFNSSRSQFSRLNESKTNPKTARRIKRLQNLIDDCSSLHLKVAQDFQEAKNTQETKIHDFTHIKSPTKPLSFWKIDKPYLEGKIQITKRKKIHDLEMRRKDLDPLSWDNFMLTSKDFQKRNFGKKADKAEFLSGLISPRYSNLKLNTADTTIERQKKFIFGNRDKSSTPSWFDRKMKREVTRTLRLDTSREVPEPNYIEEKEESIIKQEDNDIDFINHCKNMTSLKYRMRLEKLVANRNKKDFLNPSSRFHVISPSSLKLFGKIRKNEKRMS